ncbi:MAG: hypothetical protein HYV63_18280 [Candidatus Schekmanbacteria bacterium]|nr:hypothetical protein [Candidatus Schekmanbacteria bacterium]
MHREANPRSNREKSRAVAVRVAVGITAMLAGSTALAAPPVTAITGHAYLSGAADHAGIAVSLAQVHVAFSGTALTVLLIGLAAVAMVAWRRGAGRRARFAVAGAPDSVTDRGGDVQPDPDNDCSGGNRDGDERDRGDLNVHGDAYARRSRGDLDAIAAGGYRDLDSDPHRKRYGDGIVYATVHADLHADFHTNTHTNRDAHRDPHTHALPHADADGRERRRPAAARRRAAGRNHPRDNLCGAR